MKTRRLVAALVPLLLLLWTFPARADVIWEPEDGFYAARTCLTLDMAYNNARLICRPETSWIKR